MKTADAALIALCVLVAHVQGLILGLWIGGNWLRLALWLELKTSTTSKSVGQVIEQDSFLV